MYSFTPTTCTLCIDVHLCYIPYGKQWYTDVVLLITYAHMYIHLYVLYSGIFFSLKLFPFYVLRSQRVVGGKRDKDSSFVIPASCTTLWRAP